MQKSIFKNLCVCVCVCLWLPNMFGWFDGMFIYSNVRLLINSISTKEGILLLWISKKAEESGPQQERTGSRGTALSSGPGLSATCPDCLSRTPRSTSPKHIFRAHTLIKTFLTWCITYKSNSVRLLILLCGYRVPMGGLIPLFVAFWPWYL